MAHEPIRPSHTQPLRAVDDVERERLATARRLGPFIAWRDGPGALRVLDLVPGETVTVGRSAESTIAFAHVFLSRSHAEIVLRVLQVAGQPASTSVLLCDMQSKHGIEHRPLSLRDDEEVEATGSLEQVPKLPARPFQLDAGDHDVRLAGEVWLRVGAVPVDGGRTSGPPEAGVPPPTARERQVLVELCRAQFFAGRRPVPSPSNSEIASHLTPPIGGARVSDLISQMYRKYKLTGTKEQNRFTLVDLAIQQPLGPARGLHVRTPAYRVAA